MKSTTRRRWLERAALPFIAGLCAIAACDRASDRDRQDAAAVLRALEVVRSAPNEHKRRPADELATTPCNSPIVCNARDTCAAAYQHLARGTEAALRVKGELDGFEQASQDGSFRPPDDKVAQLSRELERADKEISDAKSGMRLCEEAASLMRRTFGI